MSVIKFLRDISGLFNWNTDDDPTSEQDYMNAVKNWQETEKNLVDTVLWQPTTAYSVGNMVKTPSLPSYCCLVCTTAGISGVNEPTYSTVVIGNNVSDGTVTWKICSEFSTATGVVYSKDSTINGKKLLPQDYEEYQSGNSVNVANAELTQIHSFNLTKGVWILKFITNFHNVPGIGSGNNKYVELLHGYRFGYGSTTWVNSTGLRYETSSTSEGTLVWNDIILKDTEIFKIDSSTQSVNIYVFHRSGSTIAVSNIVKAVKVLE